MLKKNINYYDREYKRTAEYIKNLPDFSKTNWIVMTGPPGSGKSTSMRLLKNKGYKVNPDISREFIVEYNSRETPLTKEKLYSRKIQRILFTLMTKDALLLKRDEFILHDYSLPCNIAFLRLGGLPVTEEVLKSARIFRYKEIFIFEPLKLVEDGVRTEDERDQFMLFKLLKESYSSLGYHPVIVKSASIRDRNDFLVAKLKELGFKKSV